jgi:glycosyltransferase involved in cell wall biosynthesis
MESRPLTVSVIIPTLNRPNELLRLFDSINIQIYRPDEIIIIDSSENEITAELCKTLEKKNKLKILYFHSPQKGLTLQRNLGLSIAQSDLILFLDDDVVLHSSCISKLRWQFVNDTKMIIGGCTGVISNSIITGLDKLGYFFGYPPIYPGKVTRFGKAIKVVSNSFYFPTQVDYLPGGFAMWRREIFDTFLYSLFFQGYGLGEDLDFSYRVSKKWKLMLDPNALCDHLHSLSGRVRDFDLGKQQVRNEHYMFINNIDHKNIFIYLLYIWSRFGLLFGNLLLSFIHPNYRRDFLSRLAGNIAGLRYIVSGGWRKEYNNYLGGKTD